MERIKRIENIINAKIKEARENAEIFAAQGKIEQAMKARAIAVALIDVQDMLSMDEQQLAELEDCYK